MSRSYRIPKSWAVQGKWLGEDAPAWLKAALVKMKRKRPVKKVRARLKRKIER